MEVQSSGDSEEKESITFDSGDRHRKTSILHSGAFEQPDANDNSNIE